MTTTIITLPSTTTEAEYEAAVKANPEAVIIGPWFPKKK